MSRGETDPPTTPAVVQRYAVIGMTCSHCEHAVATELELLDGVEHVAVDLSTGIVTVGSSRALDLGEVAGAVAAAGYEMAS